jgi:hypothetical protein
MSRVNLGGIGEFLLRHVEKIVFAVLAVFAILLIWRGVGAEWVSPTRRPEELDKLVRAAETNIVRAASVPPAKVPAREPLEPRLEPWRPQQVTIAAAPQAAALLDRPLLGEQTKRSKPAVFPIEDLQAVAGVAVFPDPAAGFAGGGFMRPPPPEAEPRRPDRDRRPDRGRRPGQRERDREDGGSLFGDFGEAMPVAADPMGMTELQQPGTVTPFVVVTGLVPAARQIAEYQNRFGTANFRDPQRDYPRWAVYLVERARVTPGGDPRWERCEITNVERNEAGGEGRMPMMPGMAAGPDPGMGQPPIPLVQETLPQSFLLQPQETDVGYAAAVPERIDRPWGTTVIHPWFLPKLEAYLDNDLADDEEEAPAEPVSLAELVRNPADFIDKRLRLDDIRLEAEPRRQPDVRLYRFGVRSADGSTKVASEPIGQGRVPVFAVSEAFARDLSISGISSVEQAGNLIVRVDRIGPTPVPRVLALELRDEAGNVVKTLIDPLPEPVLAEGGGAMFGREGMMPGMGFDPGMPLSEMRLFRFIDTDVVPGETYRYRVRFALRNPNVDLPARYLEDPAAARGEFLVSEFSNETPPIRVPEPATLVARTVPKDVARAMRIRGDAVEVMVLAPAEESGNLSLRSVVTEPGGLANVKTELNTPGKTSFFGETVVTDRILLDVRGSQEDRADSRARIPLPPLEMLFLRPDGSFELVSAAAMELQVEKYGKTLFKPNTKEPDDGKPNPAERDRRGSARPGR